MAPTRRDFLKASLGTSALLSLGPAGPIASTRAAVAAPGGAPDDTVLVVVQMAGGNDGLNTVVPYDDDEYAKHRPTLRLSAEQVHKIDDSRLGFHPRMTAFKRLYDEGRLGVVQGTGYPNPNGGHDAAMRDWQTAMPHRTECQTGWLGRTVDAVARPQDASVPAVFVGQIERPFTLNAASAIIPSIRSLDQGVLRTMPGAGGESDPNVMARAAKISRKDPGAPLAEFLRQATVAAQANSRKLEAAVRSEASAGSRGYPSNPFAQSLRTIAGLVRAELGIRIICTELGGNEPGGFDNHANQLGNHCALVHQLAESVAAFVDDLHRDRLLDRVLLITFSEFGRTVAENGRRGTGHGSAAPMFIVGGRIKPGLIGAHPNLTELENGGQKFHTDFRRVYATVLDRWLGFDSQSVLGERFEHVDMV